MTVSEIYKVLDGAAPKALSDEYVQKYGAYDNSGVLLDTGDEVKKIVFSLDLSLGAIALAKREGATLIVTHHPAIYGKIDRLSVCEPLGEKLLDCVKNGISVISMHLNLDTVEGGIDDCLREGIVKGIEKRTGKTAINESVRRMHELSRGGYGSVYPVAEISAGELAAAIDGEFRTSVKLTGDKNKKISRAASFCGAGVDEESIAFAVKNGADAIVSSDWKHHLLALCLQTGAVAVQLSHYASEEYGFEKYYEKMRESIGATCLLHRDDQLL